MINSIYAYSFLTGMYIGGYTNLFSKFIITGLVLYMTDPSKFSYENFEPLYNNVYDITYPYLSKIYKYTSHNPPLLKLKIKPSN